MTTSDNALSGDIPAPPISRLERFRRGFESRPLLVGTWSLLKLLVSFLFWVIGCGVLVAVVAMIVSTVVGVLALTAAAAVSDRSLSAGDATDWLTSTVIGFGVLGLIIGWVVGALRWMRLHSPVENGQSRRMTAIDLVRRAYVARALPSVSSYGLRLNVFGSGGLEMNTAIPNHFGGVGRSRYAADAEAARVDLTVYLASEPPFLIGSEPPLFIGRDAWLDAARGKAEKCAALAALAGSREVSNLGTVESAEQVLASAQRDADRILASVDDEALMRVVDDLCLAGTVRQRRFEQLLARA